MNIGAVLTVFGLALGAAVGASCSRESPPRPEPVPVELWYLGDIGTTVRFANAVEKAIGGSSAFRMSSGQKPGTLIVRIPANVDGIELGDREQLTYGVEFQTSTEKLIGSTTGTCWGDELSVCAEFVVKQAEIAASRMEPGS